MDPSVWMGRVQGFAKGKSLAQGELISPEHFNIPGLPRGLPRGNGMTDPFAIEQFSRLFIPTAWSVK